METITLKPKTPTESRVESRYLVMPQHANDVGIAFGGTIMSWIDMVAAMTAQKHCEHEVVTVSTDSINFLAPVRIGDHVVLTALVTYVGRTSMEISVRVVKENPCRRESLLATTAFLTMVGIDDQKRPIPIPPLRPETPEEIQRQENGRMRVLARKELLAKLKDH